MSERKDVVRSYPTIYNEDGSVYAEPSSMVKSMTFINQGTDDVVLYPNSFNITLSTGDSYVLGGYIDTLRSEDIAFEFQGAVAPKLLVVKDIIMGVAICRPPVIQN